MSKHIEKIEDGYATTVGCDDGGLIDLQIIDEELPRRTWEVLWSKGDFTTLDGLTPGDIVKLGEKLTECGEMLRAKGGKA